MVGIAPTLRSGRSEDRIPVGPRFSAHVQAGPGGPHTLLCNGYRVSLPGVKLPGHGVDHPPLSSTEVNERVEIYEGWNFNSGNYLFTTDTK